MAQLARVVVSNPRPKKRAKLRRPKKGKATEMAVKKRRRRLKRKSGPKTKRVAARKRRKAVSAAPKRRRRLKRRRVARARVSSRRARSAPRRRKRARTRRANPFARASAVNPRRRRRSSKRRGGLFKRRRSSRRNPGIPTWALAGLAGIAGLAAYAVSGAGSFALTQRIDPSMATLERNRYAAGALAAALGLGVAIFANPLVGAGIFTGGLVGLAGTDLYLALGKVLDKAPAPASAAKIAGVFEGGEQQLAGVFEGGEQQLAGVFSGGEQQLAGVGQLGAWRSPLGQNYGYGYGG